MSKLFDEFLGEAMKFVCRTGGASPGEEFPTEERPVPRWGYHGTSSVHFDSIRKEGLRPQPMANGQKTVCLGADVKTARFAADRRKAGGEPVVLRVDLRHPALNNLVMHGSSTLFELGQIIPPAAIQIKQGTRYEAI